MKNKRNEIGLEKLECSQNDGERLALVECDLKRISRNDFKINITINLLERVKDVWIHGVAYYKYNHYQKFPIDLWEDLCGWLSGKSKSYILDWFVKKLLKFSNLNHTCPYEGTIFVKNNNISYKEIQNFEVFLPSGRFRIDVNLTEGYHGRVFFMMKLYAKVSDHRVEQF